MAVITGYQRFAFTVLSFYLLLAFPLSRFFLQEFKCFFLYFIHPHITFLQRKRTQTLIRTHSRTHKFFHTTPSQACNLLYFTIRHLFVCFDDLFECHLSTRNIIKLKYIHLTLVVLFLFCIIEKETTKCNFMKKLTTRFKSTQLSPSSNRQWQKS